MLKSQIPYMLGGGGGGEAETQLPTFDAESKSAKILNSLYGVGGGGGGVKLGPNFQLLMLSPNLLKSQISHMVEGGGGCWDSTSNFSFDAESKSAKIPNFPYGGWWGEEVLGPPNFQLLMLLLVLTSGKNLE